MNACLLRLMLAGLLTAIAYPQVPTIRVAANLVLTPVSITDAGGRAIRDLKPGDFEIEENGIKVTAARLGEPGEAPLELAMLFDMSGSMVTRFELERQAAARFLNRIMRPSDSAFIVSVANEPKILQERTSSLEVALEAVARIASTTQATAFYNSVTKAARVLREVERPDARRVIVSLSDGEDNRSIENTQADALQELQLANCLFYSINPKGRSYETSIISRRAQEGMAALARETGGASFVADSVEELAAFYDRIADELQGQYLLGYYSPATSGAGIYRQIAIKVRGRPELRVKARSGYYPK
jgi:Ca-activated chloride channel family protein